MDLIRKIFTVIILALGMLTTGPIELLYVFFVWPRRKINYFDTDQSSESYFAVCLNTPNLASFALAQSVLQSEEIPYWTKNEHIQNLGFWSFVPECNLELIVPRIELDRAKEAIKTVIS